MSGLLWQPRQVSAPSFEYRSSCATPVTTSEVHARNAKSAVRNTNRMRQPLLTALWLAHQLVHVVAVVAGKLIKHDTFIFKATVIANFIVVTPRAKLRLRDALG